MALSARLLRGVHAAEGLLWRAACAATAGRPDIAWGALDALSSQGGIVSSVEIDRAAVAIAARLPDDPRADEVRVRLERRVR